MSVTVAPWGKAGNRSASLYTIANASGASLVLTDYGATAVRMCMPSPDGDIAMSFLDSTRLRSMRRRRPIAAPRLAGSETVSGAGGS